MYQKKKAEERRYKKMHFRITLAVSVFVLVIFIVTDQCSSKFIPASKLVARCDGSITARTYMNRIQMAWIPYDSTKNGLDTTLTITFKNAAHPCAIDNALVFIRYNKMITSRVQCSFVFELGPNDVPYGFYISSSNGTVPFKVEEKGLPGDNIVKLRSMSVLYLASHTYLIRVFIFDKSFDGSGRTSATFKTSSNGYRKMDNIVGLRLKQNVKMIRCFHDRKSKGIVVRSKVIADDYMRAMNASHCLDGPSADSDPGTVSFNIRINGNVDPKVYIEIRTAIATPGAFLASSIITFYDKGNVVINEWKNYAYNALPQFTYVDGMYRYTKRVFTEEASHLTSLVSRYINVRRCEAIITKGISQRFVITNSSYPITSLDIFPGSDCINKTHVPLEQVKVDPLTGAINFTYNATVNSVVYLNIVIDSKNLIANDLHILMSDFKATSLSGGH